MHKMTLSAVGLLVLVAVCGCCHTEFPSWSHPGSEDVQVRRALRYDPYPQVENGPATAGVRPREFDQPPPEPSRSRWFLNQWQ
jgi:hypothetical protein